jgi:hypothetical protein
VFWESGRPYCGRCGSELDIDDDTADVVDHMTSRRMVKPTGTDYDDGDDDEDEDDGLNGGAEEDLDDDLGDDEDEEDNR